MAHSRWLTTDNRLLLLYVATSQPSQSLVTLAEYIIKVYAPLWFEINLSLSVIMVLLIYGKQLSRFLPSTERDVVDKCIQQNGYYGHPENLLLNMMIDQRKHIRELAAERLK